MKKEICLLFMLLISMAIPVQAENIATGTLVPCCTSVDVGEEFDVTFYVETNFIATSFLIRQITWEANLAGLVNVSFGVDWYDTAFSSTGKSSPGNNTYIQSFVSTGVSGNNPAVIFTFTALNPGTLHLNIPDNIWSGQPGFEIAFSDSISWTNLEITINDDEPPPGGNGGGTTPPPVNEPPVAIINCPTIGYTNESITFSAINSTDDGTIVEYSWGFGDNHSGTGRVVNHTYLFLGNYTVLLSVTDDEGESASAFTTIQILQGESWNPDDTNETGDTNETEEPDNNDETNITQGNDSAVKEESINILVYILLGIVALLIIITILRRLKVF